MGMLGRFRVSDDCISNRRRCHHRLSCGADNSLTVNGKCLSFHGIWIQQKIAVIDAVRAAGEFQLDIMLQLYRVVSLLGTFLNSPTTVSLQSGNYGFAAAKAIVAYQGIN